MAFILAADGRDKDVAGGFERYQAYLQSVRDVFPPSAFALATSDWYFRFEDPRCPHDAWLESIEIGEHASGSRNQVRGAHLNVRLLGAYHDGHIELHYPRVCSYTLRGNLIHRGHCDWRYDELRLSERGNLIHEIEWCGATDTASWIIEASDIEFRWVPKTGSATPASV
jgi:hypothetical protein